MTPFIDRNLLIDAIEQAINIYWNKRYKNDHFEQYVVWDNLKEKQEVNLSKLKKLTEIVSIKTFDGNGKNVVFVIGLSEDSLLKFCDENQNLVYDCLIFSLYFCQLND